MSKFYAVKAEENRIFTDWDSCQAYLKGLSGYKYKSFSTKEEAEAYLEDRDYYAEIIQNDLSNGFVVAFTDGSFEETVGKYSYGVVAISPNLKERTFSARGAKAEFLSTRNIAGEVEGVLTAVRWAFLNGYERIKIYHDYEGLSAWATGRWRAESPIAVYYVQEFSKYKGVVDVTFQKVKGHSNNKYNEIVDKLAKSALFDGEEHLLLGEGYKVSGTYFYEDMVNWLNQKSPRAKITTSDRETTFICGEEKLAVFPRFTATSVVGSGGHLYALSLSYFLENHQDMGVNRLIGRCFGVNIETKTPLNGFEISKISLGFFKDNFAPSILYSLCEVENAIKKSLGVNGKISPYFSRMDDGFKCLIKQDNTIEKAYEFFYEQRVNYPSLNYTKEQATGVISKCSDIVNAINGGKYGY